MNQDTLVNSAFIDYGHMCTSFTVRKWLLLQNAAEFILLTLRFERLNNVLMTKWNRFTLGKKETDDGEHYQYY